MKTPRFSSFAAAAVAAGLSGAFAADALADGVVVPMDEVRVISFDAPVKTVFVGNPIIADITVIDSQHVFVLGKSFGTTNLIALDQQGNQKVNEQISVFGRTGEAVTVHRGAAQVTMTCTDTQCVAAPIPGDDNAPFEAVTGQIDKRNALSAKAAGN